MLFFSKKRSTRFSRRSKHISMGTGYSVHLKKNFKSVPLRYRDMKDRSTFSLYIYRLHEHINQMLNKKSGLSYEDVKERYEHFRARCTLSTKVEKGCTESLYGKKSKCVIKIVPQEQNCQTFQMDEACKKVRIRISND